jgi:hypothetical protein
VKGCRKEKFVSHPPSPLAQSPAFSPRSSPLFLVILLQTKPLEMRKAAVFCTSATLILALHSRGAPAGKDRGKGLYTSSPSSSFRYIGNEYVDPLQRQQLPPPQITSSTIPTYPQEEWREPSQSVVEHSPALYHTDYHADQWSESSPAYSHLDSEDDREELEEVAGATRKEIESAAIASSSGQGRREGRPYHFHRVRDLNLTPEENEAKTTRAREATRRYAERMLQFGLKRHLGERIPRDVFRKDAQGIANGQYEGLDPLDPEAYDIEHRRRKYILKVLRPLNRLSKEQADRMKTHELEEEFSRYKFVKRQQDSMINANSGQALSAAERTRRSREKKKLLAMPQLSDIAGKEKMSLEQLSGLLEDRQED